MESRAWDAPHFFHHSLLHHFYWAVPALAWGHWEKVSRPHRERGHRDTYSSQGGPWDSPDRGAANSHCLSPSVLTSKSITKTEGCSQVPHLQLYFLMWGSCLAVTDSYCAPQPISKGGLGWRNMACLCPWNGDRCPVFVICNHKWKVLPALLCNVSITPHKKNPISWERPSQHLSNVDQKQEDPNKNKNLQKSLGQWLIWSKSMQTLKAFVSHSSLPVSCGWECMVQARISRGWCPNPVYRQVYLSDDISYFCKVGGRKWLLLPVKNDQKSFPFCNFHFTFFKCLAVFQYCLVAPIILLFRTETCVSHSDAKFRAHPGNAQTPLFTLSPDPMSTTQASSRFYPEVLTIPPDLLFVVKSSYYKTSWPPRG